MKLLAFLAVITFTVYFGIGLHALITDIKSSINRLFSLLCFSMFLCTFFASFMYNIENAGQGIFLFRFASSFIFIFIGINLHFLIVLINRIKLKISFIILLYVPAFLLILNNIFGTPIISNIEKINDNWVFGPTFDSFWLYFYLVYLLLYFVGCNILIIYWIKKSKTYKEKKQAMLIIGSFLIFIITGVFDAWILPFFTPYNSPGLTPILFVIYILGIYIAIIKYKFLSITPELVSNEIIENTRNIVILFDDKFNIVFKNRFAEEFIIKNNNSNIIKDISKNYNFIENELNKLLRAKSNNFSTRISLNNKLMDIRFSLVKDKFGDVLGLLLIGEIVKELNQIKVFYKITDREIEVIQYLITGKTNKEIAAIINTTERTVKAHITNIYNKLTINNKIQLFNLLKDYELMEENN